MSENKIPQEAISEIGQQVQAAQPQKQSILKALFQPGEMVPLKGIWFRVVLVDDSRLELHPEALTGKMVEKLRGKLK